jgi:hypothetical protein
MEEKGKKRKLDEQLLKKLRSGDEITILKAIHDLRSSGNLDYIPVLFEILNSSGSEAVHREMAVFFADIKDARVIPLYIQGLKDPALEGARAVIASACWQSGMDYSRHLEIFLEIFLESDYLTSLESFSVIEQSLENMTDEEITRGREMLLDGLKQINEEKKPLARELVNLMQV